MTEISMAATFGDVDGPQRHIAFAQLTARGPVHPVTLPLGESAWLITGYDEVRQALQDPRLTTSQGAEAALSRGSLSEEVYAGMGQHMLNRDPPEHTRMRRLVTAAFTRRRVEQLTPRIQQIADDLLDALADKEQADLVAEFTYPLPITVICELLGIPEQRRSEFRNWADVIMTGMLVDPGDFVAACTGMVAYLRELVALKRATPGDDLLSALIEVRDGADRLSENELTSMSYLLLLAGHETTVNLVGNTILALLTHPDQLALLRAEPDLFPGAIEEMLRFDGPLQVVAFRQATEPVTIGGVTIPAGDIVVVSILAANRDPARIAEPDTLDITRKNNPHLAFGHGIHHCLAAPLARLESRIAVGTLLARFPALRLAVPPGELTWQQGVLLQGLTRLPVLLG